MFFVVQAPPIQPDIPFSCSDDLDDFIAPAKPIRKPRFLKDSKFVLPDGSYFVDPYLDKFFASGLLKGGVTGLCGASPFSSPMLSPLMTAPKKPASWRAVYDGTFGEHSLNNATPSEYYMGVRCEYSYPKIADFQQIVLKCGRGCYLWKRDLSRYYLQLPLDPTEYRHTCAVWRGLLFWTHRNKGLEYLPPNSPECSRVETIRETDPVVHQAIAPNLDPDRPLPFNCVNYSDDLAGCEETLHKSEASFKSLGELFKTLGLEKSVEKSSKPSTV
jgi:hypothetical protein